jgi:hypothetical protein
MKDQTPTAQQQRLHVTANSVRSHPKVKEKACTPGS